MKGKKMALTLSRRTAWVEQSEIRSMSIECDRIGGINLSQGVCDTEVPAVVRRGAQEAIDDGYNIYTRYDGLDELRQAIAIKQERFTGLKADPETEIVASAGATGAFYCVCLALLNPGDEVIVFEPYYGYHISTLAAAEATPVYVTMSPPDWAFRPEDLEAVITPKTRAILVNTPANPTGKIFSREELEFIGRLAEKHDLFVFTDEIYEHFVYDGLTHLCPATLPGLRDRTVTISGLSKTFSITGWRIGYAILPSQFAHAVGYFNDLIYVCAPSPLQIGVAKGLLNIGPEYYLGLAREYQDKRDMICEALNNAGLTPYSPKGAYYVLADISRMKGVNPKERAMSLLQASTVACVPGDAFYHAGGGELLGRFCFAKKNDVLQKAILHIRHLNI